MPRMPVMTNTDPYYMTAEEEAAVIERNLIDERDALTARVAELEAALIFCADVLDKYDASDADMDAASSRARAVLAMDIAERDAMRGALTEIARRLDSANAEVDCFNVVESLAIARAALAK